MAIPTQASTSQLPPGVTNPNYKPLPGRLGNLTVPQQHALETLRKQLQDEEKFVPERMDDATLLRFLRARNFDVSKAKAMIISAEEWRVEFGIEDIMKCVFSPDMRLPGYRCVSPSLETSTSKRKPKVDKYYPQYYHQMDRHGRPLFIQKLGQLDVNALYRITTQERQLQRLVAEYERFLNLRAPACAAAMGHPVETTCTVLDLYNVSLINFYRVKDYVSAASAIMQARYPETMGKFYIINAPWAFGAVWSVIKPWLDEATVAKIDILGSSYKEKLLMDIPKEHLPEEFGGSCVCDGGCSMSDAGPWKELAANGDEKFVNVAW
ncbi:hypothetical protein EVG20_g6743 [Dentipellis fragilis]|uniref:CRAL-TRIO domain-containing protein n=1 Tax=Dentipellis fragilis TaxID=205917 RepID=A0A4Y9YIX5_9AGAM|nr:hypothetical protein EVG20_g6743 [Dentipellis fragilis]